MTGDENDRRTVSVRQFPLEFQATRVRKLQVQDQASGRIGFFGFQEFRSGPECDYSKSHGCYQAGQRFAYSIVVIHHEDDGVVRVHCISLGLSGIVKQTLAPGSSLGATQSRP
jgi:hypothetical protein